MHDALEEREFGAIPGNPVALINTAGIAGVRVNRPPELASYTFADQVVTQRILVNLILADVLAAPLAFNHGIAFVNQVTPKRAPDLRHIVGEGRIVELRQDRDAGAVGVRRENEPVVGNTGNGARFMQVLSPIGGVTAGVGVVADAFHPDRDIRVDA